MIIPLIIANGNFISILFNLSVFWEMKHTNTVLTASRKTASYVLTQSAAVPANTLTETALKTVCVRWSGYSSRIPSLYTDLQIIPALKNSLVRESK